MLSPLKRPLCVVGRPGGKKKRERRARWEGEREKRGSRLNVTRKNLGDLVMMRSRHIRRC